MKYDVEFYQKENGDVPVLEFLLSLENKLSQATLSLVRGSEPREYLVKIDKA